MPAATRPNRPPDAIALLKRYARSIDRLLEAAEEVRRERDRLLLAGVGAVDADQEGRRAD